MFTRQVIIIQMRFLLYFFLSSLVIEAQTWNVNPDYWSATDALGRTTPTEQMVGPAKSGKYVGIFYSTWHSDQMADFSPVINISNILRKDPNAAHELNNPAW